MGGTHRQILVKTLVALDLLIMTGCFLVAAVPVFQASDAVTFAHFLSMRIKIENFIRFFGLVAGWHIVLRSLGLYQSRRLASLSAEVTDVVKATSLCTLSVGLATALFTIKMVTPIFLVVFWFLTTTLEVASRLLLRYFLEQTRRRGRNIRHILIVGTNSRAVAFARKVESRLESGYRVIGFADEPWEHLEEFCKVGYPLVCDLENLAQFVRNMIVDEVIIGLPIKSYYYQASRIAALCEVHGIVVRFLSGIFDLKLARSRAEEFEGDALITLYTGPIDGWPIFAKRVLDIVLSLILIILLAPLFLVTALLMKVTSPGPVFFTQERMGLNKRKFRIWKFRTMGVDAERRQAAVERLNEVSGPVFKIKNDPRVTPLGRVLRKTSIDELPQLFNVFKGEMSLVGPRPLPVRDYKGFDQDWHRRRFSVRPGMTCLWQICGRSSIEFDKWMELDMQYIDEWSLWLDFKILAGTIPAVVRGSGAA